MNRRKFIGLSATAAAAALWRMRTEDVRAEPKVSPAKRVQPKIPRRRGFNLTELAGGHNASQGYRESDFQWIAEWGFDFARLPCSYWTWSEPNRWMEIDEGKLAPLDQAVEWGRHYNIHINLNLHRIPGYCVNGREREPHQLFDSPREEMQQALDAAVHQWQFLARRYRSVPSHRLSFDLFNEPPFMSDQGRYVEIARALIAAIRAESPDRLIVADGADIGQTPVMGLVDEGIVQSTRGYLPKMISHYTATWVPKQEFESFAFPTWPMVDAKGQRWDQDKLRQVLVDPWRPLMQLDVPIHVGEWGCYTATPHEVALAWMRDMLAVWKEVGWGWSLWNLRGGFGVVDSGRPDVKYEAFRGHQLDRAMLELLLAN